MTYDLPVMTYDLHVMTYDHPVVTYDHRVSSGLVVGILLHHHFIMALRRLSAQDEGADLIAIVMGLACLPGNDTRVRSNDEPILSHGIERSRTTVTCITAAMTHFLVFLVLC